MTQLHLDVIIGLSTTKNMKKILVILLILIPCSLLSQSVIRADRNVGSVGVGDTISYIATKYDIDTLISNGVQGVAYSELITMKGGGYDSTQMLPAEVTRYTEMPLGYSTGMVVDSVFLHIIGAASPSFTLDIYFGNNPTDTVNATNVTKRLIVTSNGTKRFGGAYIINGAIAWGNTVFAVVRASSTPPRRVGIIIIGHRQ